MQTINFETIFKPFAPVDVQTTIQQARAAAVATVREREHNSASRGYTRDRDSRRDQGRDRESDRHRDQGQDRESDRQRDQGRDRESDRQRDRESDRRN